MPDSRRTGRLDQVARPDSGRKQRLSLRAQLLAIELGVVVPQRAPLPFVPVAAPHVGLCESRERGPRLAGFAPLDFRLTGDRERAALVSVGVLPACPRYSIRSIPAAPKGCGPERFCVLRRVKVHGGAAAAGHHAEGGAVVAMRIPMVTA